MKLAKKGESFWEESNRDICERCNKGKQGKGAPKTSAFKRILGVRVISRFLEVEETSPPLCNMNFASKTPYCS